MGVAKLLAVLMLEALICILKVLGGFFCFLFPYLETIHQEQQQAWAKFSLIQDPACKGILKRACLEGKGQEEGTTAKQAVPSGKRSCLGNWLCSPLPSSVKGGGLVVVRKDVYELLGRGRIGFGSWRKQERGWYVGELIKVWVSWCMAYRLRAPHKSRWGPGLLHPHPPAHSGIRQPRTGPESFGKLPHTKHVGGKRP